MSSSIPLSFIFLSLLLHCCTAQLGQGQQFFWQNLQQQQQHRLRARTDCRIERLTAQEPTIRFEAEAGRAEFWDQNNQDFQCAGVTAVRNHIEPKGLLLPHYNNAPQLLYVVRGRGLLGAVFSGCAETYESEQSYERESEQFQGSEQSRRFDRHQKVRQFRQGDVLALPAGVTLWFYNNAEEPLVTVALLDVSNEINQLDQTFRNYFLGGKPRNMQQSYSTGYRQKEQQHQGERYNMFYGFDDEILAQVFNVNREIVRQMKNQDDTRGHIVRAERFNIVVPQAEEEYQRERGQFSANGLEETICSVKLKANIDHPALADIYNPRGGRISTLNSQKLPILSWLQLSAERGILYRNAINAPHYNINAHALVYFTRGRGRVQIVNHNGKSVFDGHVQEGQMLVVPQNFVCLKKASEEQGLEWISFKTNDNAMTSQLAGRLSVIRGMPEEVLMNSYDISREDARRLKYRREEAKVFSSSPRSYRPRPFEYAMDVIKAMM